MTSGTSGDRKRYEWQSWPSDSLEGMPPKRRRLVVWVLWWLIILSVVPEIVLDALRVPQPWRSFAYTAVVVAIFAPLIGEPSMKHAPFGLRVSMCPRTRSPARH
jgi:hypothetical protein